MGHPRHRKRRESRHSDEPSFIYLTIKVGSCILCIGWAVTHIVLLFSYPKSQSSAETSSDHSPHSIRSQFEARYDASENAERNARVDSKFPVFQLDSQCLSDAYGVHDTIAKYNSHQHQSVGLDEFYDEMSRLKKQFASLYGGENAARFLIHSGVTTLHSSGDSTHTGKIFDAYDMRNIPSGLKHTSYRLLSARQQNRPFKIAFGGYSVTAGRGNYFNQSYPFVLEKLLKRPFELVGIELQVRNAAIGGVPSFPYGWCLDNFLGDDADVVSWDYSMNEAGGVADGLEAYIRHCLSMKRQPMLIVKDTSISIARERHDLLQSYVDIGALKDPIVLGIEDAIDSFLNLKEDLLPIGFREWRKFGAPNGSPGQTSHHPGVKEHELYGWLIAMHFLAVLELVAFVLSNERHNDTLLNTVAKEGPLTARHFLPAPIHGKNIAPPELFSLFYGTFASNGWQMNPIHCRTTYDPILKNNLHNVVVSGTSGEDLNIMLPRGAQLYNKGWVLDLGDGEKKAKKKLERFGGLGYIDQKTAYYGIHSSGPLDLFLPCIGRDDIVQIIQDSSDEVLARDCFQNVVVCEVNEKHTRQECNLNNDLSFRVGSIKSHDVKPVNATGAFYWGRNICIRVDIPSESVLSKRESKTKEGFDIGISLRIVANKSVILRSGPCSISHLIWEQGTR